MTAPLPTPGHPFRPRFIFRGGELVELPDQCGFVIDAMLNAPASDEVHCNVGRSEANGRCRIPGVLTAVVVGLLLLAPAA